MSITTEELSKLAARMLADYDEITPGLIFADGLRLELSDAWSLQTAVTRLREARAEKVIGYKVGAVDPGNQKMMGLPHPVWGRLWDTERHSDGAALKKSNYDNIAIEAEFGVTLSRDLAPGMSGDDIAESIEAIFPVLELHNLQMRGDAPHGHELIANNCINCGVVSGAAVTDLSTPRETDLKLIYDGQVVDAWESLAWPGDILRAMDWLISSLSEHDLILKAGSLVLTSAWGPPIPVADASRVSVSSSAFGTVGASFE